MGAGNHPSCISVLLTRCVGLLRSVPAAHTSGLELLQTLARQDCFEHCRFPIEREDDHVLFGRCSAPIPQMLVDKQAGFVSLVVAGFHSQSSP